VLRELKEGRVSSAAAVVTALAFTSAGYVRGKLPGATAGVRMPGDREMGLAPLTPPPASGTGQNIAAQSPTASNPSAEKVGARPSPASATAQNIAAQTPTAGNPGAERIGADPDAGA
jgi:hypothetical protein